MTYDWRHDALCATHEEPDLWFPASLNPPHTLDVAEAKAICRHCPVMNQCRRWAVDNGMDDGIWGGLDWEQLRLERRRAHRGKGRPEPSPCGTLAAYRRHMRHHERIDAACRDANRLHKAAQAERLAVAQ